MKAVSWVRARPKAFASAAAVTAGVMAISLLALTYDGNPTTELELHDGGIWITKSSNLLVGHFNYPSTVLDGAVRTTGESFDILQSGATILVVDTQENAVTSVDPARVSMVDDATIPTEAKVALGHNTVAVLDRASGDLWVASAQGLSALEIQGSDPIAELGRGADVAVGADGTVHAVSAKDASIVSIPVDAEGEPKDPSTTALSSLSDNASPTITVVGGTPVVFDDVAGAVLTARGLTTPVDRAEGAALQQPSPEGSEVLLATTSQLVSIPLDGGEPSSVDTGAQGSPAAPVQMLGCHYGAWSGSGAFVRDCITDDFDLETTLTDLDPTAELVFRVNRDVIMLNDVVGGAAWLADESLQRVDNWDDITPPEGEAEEDEKTSEETVETTLPERSEINTAPIAIDDSFGVRPGGTTVLPVLDNDTDADGDVLVAALVGDQPSLGVVQPIQNGGALQIDVPENAAGSATFRYAIDDGRGGTDEADVRLTVHDWSTNAPPAQKRITTIAVELGGTVSYNVLPDWSDPNGDDIYLRAVVPADGDEVDHATDGQLTYRALGTMLGRKEVEVVVADGVGGLSTGTLILDVRPQGSTLPTTNADHVVTRVGQQVTVAPLANDTSSGREPLRLARVDEVPDTRITADFANKTFDFVSDRAGVYYVQYLVTAGPTPVPGLVRVDVFPPDETDAAPIAVRDVALLPAGGEVLVGVLNNDTEPSGGILVVQSVTVDPGSGVSVSVLNHETLRISDQGMLDEQVRLTYRISNGSKTAEGDVIVIPIPSADKLLPPVANDDQAVVRAGDVVTIPVLDNDSHPNGDALHVAPDLVEPLIDPADGEIFVSQNTVRFRAGPEAKTVYATYEAVDSTGQKDAGYITIQILAIDEDNNAAPRPRDLTARALSGTVVRIPVPTDGLDPDGDSVELLGLASSPTLGGIVEVGPNYFDYEAFEDSAGVDTFRYEVRDRLGKTGVGTVRVGIAPPESINQPPYAVKDSLIVRPGREVAVPVLANDSDPEGDQIALVASGLILPDVEGLDARVLGDRVIVTAPDRPMETSLQYTIRDARGLTARAVLQITVDENVPLQRPIARDDRIQLADITEQLTVAVDVLTNDEDPDGTVDALQLRAGEGGTVLPDGRIQVQITDERQLVRYTITDQDEQGASAFIFVPAISELRPTLLSATPVEVKSGETIVLPLSEYVTVVGGGSLVLTEAAKVSAINADGASLIRDQQTLVYTSAQGYHGPDALTFEVTDGTGPDDPAGRKATLTIPITVLPPDNQQPSFLGSEMQVAPGEDATGLDLRALTTDPDPGDVERMRYTIVSGPGDGMSARVDGGTLLVDAATTTPKGTTGSVTLRIEDGETAPIEGTVHVRVTASTRELAAANTDVVAEAHQGRTETVSVLDNDFNPFPETPLTVLSATVETGNGTARVAGSNVEITPDSSFVGSMVVRYRVQDATGDRDREVDGRITLTVLGVPDAPGTPSVSSVQDRTVVLSWSPPANNGAEITGYTVSSIQGTQYSKACAATTCTLDGLTNNVEYVFQVVAHNRVGDSPVSPGSEIARPDARPDTPAPPTLAFGDRSLSINWVTPTTPGSPVENFTLEISPAPPSGISQRAGLTGNSVVWDGLENGVSYQVRVRAHNRAPDPSSWSNWSTAMIPAGRPAALGAPVTTELAPVGNQAQMQVNWVRLTGSQENGDAVSGYELEVRRGSTVVQTLTPSAGATSQAVVVPTSETGYTYRIRARNKAGWGDWSSASAERRGVIAPGAPSTPTVTVGDRRLTVSYSLAAEARNGARANEISYQYQLNGGNWQSNWNGSTITGLSNGTNYTVRVRAVASVGGQTYAGAQSGASAGAIPYGPVGNPGATATNQGTSVRVGWSAPSPNGRPIDRVQIRINEGSWETVGNSGSRNVGNGYQQNWRIDVRAYDTAGQVSSVVSASARTNDPPAPRIWVEHGGAPSGQSCVNGCERFRVHWQNASSLGTRQVWCSVTGASSFAGPYTVNFSGGSGTQTLSCWSGRDNVNAWVEISGYGSSETRYWGR